MKAAAFQWCMGTTRYVDPAVDCTLHMHPNHETEVWYTANGEYGAQVYMYVAGGKSGRVNARWKTSLTDVSDCPAGKQLGIDWYDCDDPEYYVEPPPPKSCPNNESNPCDPASGNKSQVEVDFVSPGDIGVEFKRY